MPHQLLLLGPVTAGFGQDGFPALFPSAVRRAGVVIAAPHPAHRRPQRDLPDLGPVLLQALASRSYAISMGFLDGGLALLEGQLEGPPGRGGMQQLHGEMMLRDRYVLPPTARHDCGGLRL